jgi:hypothetical protein
MINYAPLFHEAMQRAPHFEANKMQLLGVDLSQITFSSIRQRVEIEFLTWCVPAGSA